MKYIKIIKIPKYLDQLLVMNKRGERGKVGITKPTLL